ncbi:MAG: DUF5010 domain-containing protein [Chloroflexota bacterium]
MLLTLACSAVLMFGTPASALAQACTDGSDSTGFRTDARLVLTYYYYWYDEDSLDDLALALHPPSGVPFDWREKAWHARQFADMAEVGIDVALPVYWGTGPEWSIIGLDHMVEARRDRVARGLAAPYLGLFFDSNLYAEVQKDRPELTDLTTSDGQHFFADQIIAFFDRVPACDRALVDGRPLVFLWRPDNEDGGAFNFDDASMERIYDLVEERLGTRPYIVRERTWDIAAEKLGIGTPVQTDDVYTWGSTLSGPRFTGHTVSVGPGYDDRTVPDRIGYTRDREEGAVYERELRSAATGGARWILIETWNEFYEATGIAETTELGRSYLDITRRYVRLFHLLGEDSARDARVDLANGQGSYLSRLAYAAEEQGVPGEAEGRFGARPILDENTRMGYFHFAIRPRAHPDGSGRLDVTVEYFDEGQGSFTLEYDRLGDPLAPYATAEEVQFTDTREWRAHRFVLEAPLISGRQYDGYGDFRLRDTPGESGETHLFGRVLMSIAVGERPILLGPGDFSGPDPDGNVELRWVGLPGVADYLVQLRRPDFPALGLSADSAPVGIRCPGRLEEPRPGPNAAFPLERACVLGGFTPESRGLYRWRIWAVGPDGRTAGQPSDWGYLLVGEP